MTAGEQTYMRNENTTGGITHFQTPKATVLKCVRNRSSQTKFVESLKEKELAAIRNNQVGQNS